MGKTDKTSTVAKPFTPKELSETITQSFAMATKHNDGNTGGVSGPSPFLTPFWRFFSRILSSIGRSLRNTCWSSHARSSLSTPIFGNLGIIAGLGGAGEKGYVKAQARG